MNTTPNGTGPAGWLLRRDVDAVAAHLDRWILAAGAQPMPVLGSPEWVVAGEVARSAAVAVYTLACLAETEPTVIAARLAAEIAAGRALRMAALREASHAIAAGHDWTAEAERGRYVDLAARRARPGPPVAAPLDTDGEPA